MLKKHIAIEILPRLLWAIQGVTLFLVYYLSNEKAKITEDGFAFAIGVVVTVIGLIYGIWTFRFLAKPMITKELVTSGPYRYTRHPMYVALYIILIGIGLLFFTKPWFIVLLIFIPFWYIDCKLEEKQMTDLYGEKYKEYKKRVGMFLPFK